MNGHADYSIIQLLTGVPSRLCKDVPGKRKECNKRCIASEFHPTAVTKTTVSHEMPAYEVQINALNRFREGVRCVSTLFDNGIIR